MIIVENLRKKNFPEQPGAGAEADAGQEHSGNWSGLGACPFLLRCSPCTSVCEMKKYMMKHSLFLALIWCAALVLCASCVMRHVRGTNGNLGVWLTDGLAAGLLAYAVWQIAARLNAKNAARENSSYGGVQMIGEVSLADENE